MNLDKTTKALKKINRLYEIISDIGEASATERDLLRAYAKDLYESLSDDKLDDSVDQQIKEDLKKKEAKKLKKEQELKALKKKEALEKEQIAKEAAQETIIEELPEKKVPLVAVPASMPSSASDTKQAAPAALSGFSPAMREIFEVNEISELSDKLSQAPIADLTRAMGLNEKIFTVNELFDGNNDEFNNLMKALNGLPSYDEASKVLMKSAASKYDWDSDEKQKKARTFVKLIQRRYK